MQRIHQTALNTFDAVRPGSRRRRVLEYIASQGGELRSESGQGLRRQICNALGDRPTQVSQALIALERTGFLEREMDLDRHRCHAIRLVANQPDALERSGRGVDQIRQPLDNSGQVRVLVEVAAGPRE